jgi:hypothetical protein
MRKKLHQGNDTGASPQNTAEGGGSRSHAASGESLALMRQALKRHLKHLQELELEDRDRRGYLAKPQSEDEYRIWEGIASWPQA